jgi:hypothetical protein
MEINDRRYFSFSKEAYEIKEIIDNANINMEWKWEDSICPHCKHRIERKMIHTFHQIEILVKTVNNETNNNPSQEDLLIIGHTTDGRIMQVPKGEKIYKEILNKSNKFQEFSEVK